MITALEIMMQVWVDGNDGNGWTQERNELEHHIGMFLIAERYGEMQASGIGISNDADILETIDNAWNYIKKNNIQGKLQNSTGNRIYNVPMSGPVGTQGGKLGNGRKLNTIELILKDGTTDVISAYPK